MIMTIVTSYDVESDTWTHHTDDTAARAAWRQAVADIAAKARAKLPECNGRVDAAVKLVLAGDVELLADGTAQVASQSHGTTAYHLVNGQCDCRDYAKAPHNFCKHRLSVAIARRAQELTRAQLGVPATTAAQAGQSAGDMPPEPSPTPDATTGHPGASQAMTIPPLPEAPASVNVYLELGGRQVQLTLRGTDERAVLARLEAVLQRFPVPAKPAPTAAAEPEHSCPLHHTPMTYQENARGGWWSHALADGGWCKGKHSQGQRR
jgi:hypothetical protein